MSNIDILSNSKKSPLGEGLKKVFSHKPLSPDINPNQAYTYIHEVITDENLGGLAGFDSGIIYSIEHISLLSQILIKIASSDEYKNTKNIPLPLLHGWQELQGKVLMEKLAPEIERVAGETITHVYNSRTRINDIIGKPSIANYAKAGVAMGSFGIMGLFQYRFMESVLLAIAQADMNDKDGKVGLIAKMVENHAVLGSTSLAWSVLSTCAFAWMIKTGFETHLSDKLMGTKQTKKKSLCVLGCAALLSLEMTGSFSRITIGNDLKEQVVSMASGIESATMGDKNVFDAFITQTKEIKDQYKQEGQEMYSAEAARGGIGPYAGGKQAAYLKKSELDVGLIGKSPGLTQKVENLYTNLEKNRENIKGIQIQYKISVKNSTSETSGPLVIGGSIPFSVDQSRKSLNEFAKTQTHDLLESHNLIDPGFADVIGDLVFDSGKKLHPDDVNKLRKTLDAKIDSTGKNIDALNQELNKAIRNIDSFMIDITEEANRKYKSETAYQKKPLPESIDTSALKNALNQTKVDVTVLEPWKVWPKFMELTENGTISVGYSLALILRVLLVEGLLLGIGFMRVRSTVKSLSTPGAHFEDLARETDGTYLHIIENIENLTSSKAWQTVNGRALSREEIHTIITMSLGKEEGQEKIGNQLSVVTEDGKTIQSRKTSIKDLLSAAFFGQYSAPEIRRLANLDSALTYWKTDITGESDDDEKLTLKEKFASLLGKINLGKVSPSPDPVSEVLLEGENGWDIPEIDIQDGQHMVRFNIESVLNGRKSLDILSTANAKRIANEDTGKKRREWESISKGLNSLLTNNHSVVDLVSRIRSDEKHTLHNDIVLLDQTGDVFGYYTDKVFHLNEELQILYGTQSPKEFFGTRERFVSNTIKGLKISLVRLMKSGLLQSGELDEVSNFQKLNDTELISKENHEQISQLFKKYEHEEYVRDTIIMEHGSESEVFNPGIYAEKLGKIDLNSERARWIEAEIKKAKEYIGKGSDHITELEVISLRNSSDKLRSFIREYEEEV